MQREQGYLREGSEPSEVEPRGGAGWPGGVADEEGGLREVELGGDGLHPPLVRGGPGGVLLFQEAHRGGVALERLGRERIHLRRDHAVPPRRRHGANVSSSQPSAIQEEKMGKSY
jgi:hypothetical protein